VNRHLAGEDERTEKTSCPHDPVAVKTTWA
jgi:hypothetical protein